MTWIVTNGKSGDDVRYVHIKYGGFFWTELREAALRLADQQSAMDVACGMTNPAFPVAVVDEVLA